MKFRLLIKLALFMLILPSPQSVLAEDWTFQRIQNYPYQSDYDFKKVQAGVTELREQLREHYGSKKDSQRDFMERYLNEVEAFTRTSKLSGEDYSIVNFAKTDNKAIAALRNDIKLPVPKGGAILRIFDSKQKMPQAIQFLFGATTGGVTRWCRYSAVIRDEKSDKEIQDTISHELAHAYIGSVIGSNPDTLPRWFHEGTAMYLSGAEARYISMRDFGSRIAFSPPDYEEYRIVFEYLNDYAGRDRVFKFIHDAVTQRSVDKPLKEVADVSSYTQLRKQALEWNSEWKDTSSYGLIGLILGCVLLIYLATKARAKRIEKALMLISEARILTRAGLLDQARENLDAARKLESHSAKVRMALQNGEEDIRVFLYNTNRIF